MPSYEILTPPPSIGPVEYMVDRDAYDTYDYTDARPRRYTDYDSAVDLVPPPLERRSSRKHGHSSSGGSRESRSRKRSTVYLGDRPLNIQIIDRKPSSRKSKGDGVVIINSRGGEKDSKERLLAREEREREKERDRDGHDPYTTTAASSSRRGSFSRDAFLGRSSAGLDNDFYTSTSRADPQAEPSRLSSRKSSSRRLDDILPPTSSHPLRDTSIGSSAGSRENRYDVTEAAPRDTAYYTTDDDEARRSSHKHRHRHGHHHSSHDRDRERDSDRERERERDKDHSQRHHHQPHTGHHTSRRHERERDGAWVEIEEANSSSRRARAKRYIEERLSRDSLHRSDLDKAEEELARQRRRAVADDHQKQQPAPEPSSSYKGKEKEKASRFKYSGAYSKSADQYEDHDKYDNKKHGDDRHPENKYTSSSRASKYVDVPKDVYADDRAGYTAKADRLAEDRARYAEEKYLASKAAKEDRHGSSRPSKQQHYDDQHDVKYGDKHGSKYGDKHVDDRRHAAKSDEELDRNSSSKYAAGAAAAAAAASAAAGLGAASGLMPKIYDTTSKFDELERSGKYEDLANYKLEKYEKSENRSRDESSRHDKYATEDQPSGSNYSAGGSKYGGGSGSGKEFSRLDRIDSFDAKPPTRRSSYVAPTVEEVDDDDRISRHARRSSKHGSGGDEPLFLSPQASPRSASASPAPSDKTAYPSKKDRIEREAREDIDSSSLALSDADTDSMLERRLEVARMRAEILRMKELQAVEEQAGRSRRGSPSGGESRQAETDLRRTPSGSGGRRKGVSFDV